MYETEEIDEAIGDAINYINSAVVSLTEMDCEDDREMLMETMRSLVARRESLIEEISEGRKRDLEYLEHEYRKEVL